MKLAGRDAGKVCVVVDQLDKHFVLIDGNVRRRKCNMLHLEPLPDTIKIKKNAAHSEVADEFKKLKLPVWHTKPKPKTEKLQPKRKIKKETKSEKSIAEKSKKETKSEKPKKEEKTEKKEEMKEAKVRKAKKE